MATATLPEDDNVGALVEPDELALTVASVLFATIGLRDSGAFVPVVVVPPLEAEPLDDELLEEEDDVVVAPPLLLLLLDDDDDDDDELVAPPLLLDDEPGLVGWRKTQRPKRS